MKILFKIIISFAIIIFNFNIINFAETNTIREVDITINVKTDGTANVIEFWNADVYSGTELYHSFEDIDKNNITNFCVYEDGQKFKQIDVWDISCPIEDKKQKYGINENEDDIELCWGIGEYGFHSYKLTYTIKDFLINNEINFNIFNFKTPPPRIVNIKLKGNFDSNVFAKLRKCNGNIDIKKGEINFKVENLNYNQEIGLYINYDGIDNSIIKDKIIKITENHNQIVLKILKKIIISIFIISVILICIIIIFSSKKERLEFRPF